MCPNIRPQKMMMMMAVLIVEMVVRVIYLSAQRFDKKLDLHSVKMIVD